MLVLVACKGREKVCQNHIMADSIWSWLWGRFFLANFKVERAGRPPSKNITIAPPTIFCPLVRRHGKKSSIMCQLILDGYYLAKHSHDQLLFFRNTISPQNFSWLYGSLQSWRFRSERAWTPCNQKVSCCFLWLLFTKWIVGVYAKKGNLSPV